MTHLRRIMLEELQRRNYSDSTARYYLRAVLFKTHILHCLLWMGKYICKSYENGLSASKITLHRGRKRIGNVKSGSVQDSSTSRRRMISRRMRFPESPKCWLWENCSSNQTERTPSF